MKVFSVTVVPLMLVLNCTSMLEFPAISRALEAGVLEETVRPTADTGVGGDNTERESTQASTITRVSLFQYVVSVPDLLDRHYKLSHIIYC